MSDVVRLPCRRCGACGCWCSTSTACSPTAACTTARKGEALKAFHVRDGHGIKQVAAAGITVAIISGRKSAAGRAPRARTRHPPRHAGRERQARGARRKLAKARALPLEHCACVGDDTPDAPILARRRAWPSPWRMRMPMRCAAAHLVTTRARRPRRGARGLRLAARRARGAAHEVLVAPAGITWPRSPSSRAPISSAAPAAATTRRTPAAALPPDPGYAAARRRSHRNRLRRARALSPQCQGHPPADAIPASSISKTLEMDYHPGAQGNVPGETPHTGRRRREIWHLKSDRGQVRADGDDVQLNGNVVVTGPGAGHRRAAVADHRNHAHQHSDGVHRDRCAR